MIYKQTYITVIFNSLNKMSQYHKMDVKFKIMSKIISVKTQPTIHFKWINLLNVNYTSLKLIKNTLKVKNKIRKVSELVPKTENSDKKA